MRLIKAVKVREFLAPIHWPTWFAIGLMRVVTSLPLRWIEWTGFAFGQLLYLSMTQRRRIGEINLAIAFPDESPQQIRQRNKICFRNLGMAAFELGLSWWQSEKLLDVCEIDGLEHLRQALQRRHGVIILTAHFTCLEIGGPILNHYVPFQVMYKRAHNRLFDGFMKYHRGRLYKAIVDHHKPITMIKGLKKGYAAWYAPDQDFGSKDTLFVPFFGIDATALTAPARIAKIANAPVVPYYIQRKPKGQGYRLTVLPALKNFPSEDAQSDALLINQVLEQLIMRNPDQYLWVHKRYKNRPENQPPIYPKRK